MISLGLFLYNIDLVVVLNEIMKKIYIIWGKSLMMISSNLNLIATIIPEQQRKLSWIIFLCCSRISTVNHKFRCTHCVVVCNFFHVSGDYIISFELIRVATPCESNAKAKASKLRQRQSPKIKAPDEKPYNRSIVRIILFCKTKMGFCMEPRSLDFTMRWQLVHLE